MGYYMAGGGTQPAVTTMAVGVRDPGWSQEEEYFPRRQPIDKMNPRALRRALSRLKSFERFGRKAVAQVERLKMKHRRRG